MFCGLCGTRNSRNNKFCRECGARLEPPTPVEPLPEEEFAFLSRESDSSSPDASRARELLDEAFRCYQADHLEEAQQRCREALALTPRSTSAHSLLALLYEKQGDIPQAIREYEIVLEINPDSSADRTRLARLRGEAETPSGGENITPSGPPSWLIPAGVAGALLLLALVVILSVWNRPPQAPSAPDGGPVENLLAQGQTYYAQQRYAEALDCFRQALALDSSNEQAQSMALEAQRRLSSPPAPVASTPPLPGPTSPATETSVPAAEPPSPPQHGTSPGTGVAPPPTPSPPRVASRPSPARSNGSAPGGNRVAPVHPSAIPSGPIPAPVISESQRGVLPSLAEAIPPTDQAQSTLMAPAPITAVPQPTPGPQGTPMPATPPPSEQPPEQEDSYIRITVKEAPASPGPPRRPASEPSPEPASQPQPTAPAPTQPVAAKRDLLAEARALEARALRLSAQGDYRAALRAYQQALDTAPDSPRSGQLQQAMGLCYQKLDQHRQALSTLKKAEQKLAQKTTPGTADRVRQRALRATREAIKASEEYLQGKGDER